MKLRAEQSGLIPLPSLLFNRAVTVCEQVEPTTRFDGSYLEDQHGRRGALCFQTSNQPRRHWLARLLLA